MNKVRTYELHVGVGSVRIEGAGFPLMRSGTITAIDARDMEPLVAALKHAQEVVGAESVSADEEIRLLNHISEALAHFDSSTQEGEGPMNLRASQLETLRRAKAFGGEIRVWQVAEQLHADNWAALQHLQEIQRARCVWEISVPDAPLPDRSFELSNPGRTALAQEGKTND